MLRLEFCLQIYVLILAAFIYAELYEIAVGIAQIDTLHSAARACARHELSSICAPFLSSSFLSCCALSFADEAKVRRARARTRCKRRKLSRAGVDIDL